AGERAWASHGLPPRSEAAEEVAPERRPDAIDEQHAVEVIHLVLQRASEQPPAFDHARLSVPIERLHRGAFRPDHRRGEAGDAEAAFLLELEAFPCDERRVDADEDRSGIRP